MTGLPRSIIKKYGVTKKAWAVFRGGSRARSRPAGRRPRRRMSVMPRRRFSRRRHSGGGGFGFGGVRQALNPKKLAMAALAAGAATYVARKFAPEYAEWAAIGAGALAGPGGIAGKVIGAVVGKVAGAPIANAAESVEQRLVSGVSSAGTGGASFY